MCGRWSHSSESLAKVISEGLTIPAGFQSQFYFGTCYPSSSNGQNTGRVSSPRESVIFWAPTHLAPNFWDLALFPVPIMRFRVWWLGRCSAEEDEGLVALGRSMEKLRDGKGRGTGRGEGQKWEEKAKV